MMHTNMWLQKNIILAIISFDSDFDRTELKRKTPREVIESEENR